MSFETLMERYWGILNTDLNRMLTSASGTGVWKTEKQVQEVLDTEFGGQDHLVVVEVIREH